jgi:hypothetical protein
LAAFIIIAAVCFLLGLGLVATGAHLTGILFIVIAVFGFWLSVSCASSAN